MQLDYNCEIVAEMISVFKGYCHPVKIYNLIRRMEGDRLSICNEVVNYKKKNNGIGIEQVLEDLKISLRN
jgi:hypothetical protein